MGLNDLLTGLRSRAEKQQKSAIQKYREVVAHVARDETVDFPYAESVLKEVGKMPDELAEDVEVQRVQDELQAFIAGEDEVQLRAEWKRLADEHRKASDELPDIIKRERERVGKLGVQVEAMRGKFGRISEAGKLVKELSSSSATVPDAALKQCDGVLSMHRKKMAGR